MPITLKQVQSKKDLKKFVYLPETLNANQKGWVPPLYSDDLRVLDAKKNPAHEYCDTIYFLAYDGDKLVGRIAGVVNKRYNQYAETSSARFGYLEAPERFEVVQTLVEAVEKWAKEKGLKRIIGPMGLTEEDPLGFIFEGYDETPTLACNQNLPYMNKFMEKLGYAKELDYMVYKTDIAGANTELLRKFYERASRNPAFSLKEFTKKSELKPYIKPLFKLMNDSFDEIYGYSPLDEKDVDDLAKRYLPQVDPRFIKIVITPQDEVIGFMISIPNMAPGFIKARGRLFPFGFIHILNAAKHSIQLDNYLGAIRKDYRGKGVDALIGYSLLRTALSLGFKFMDSHHEMETNTKIRAEMERAGGVIYKKFRLYFKELQK